MNFLDIEFKNEVNKLPNDNIVKSVYYRINNLVSDCIFYNSNVFFGFEFNSILEDINYMKSNNLRTNSFSSEVIFNVFCNELNQSVKDINQLMKSNFECKQTLFLS